jgi:hypothetical protein
MNLTQDIIETREAYNKAKDERDALVMAEARATELGAYAPAIGEATNAAVMRVAQLGVRLDRLMDQQRNAIANHQRDSERAFETAYSPTTGKLTHFGTTIHGRSCWVVIDKDHGAGTYDVTVVRGPGKLAGRSFRVTGCFPEFQAA